MLKRLVNEARLSLTIETTGPLLIKSGYATLTGPDMTPVLTFRNGASQVYIPGSSLKGVFRSHIEKVIRTLRPTEIVVADPFKKDDEPDQACSTWFQQRKQKETLDNETVYADSDPISRLFGSTFFIGRVSIGDAYLIDDSDRSKRLPTEPRDGVSIDRLTGGAASGALFNLEVVTTGTVFRTEILLRNFECWQLGAILLVVQDIHDELIRLGSGTSRGLGAVKGNVEHVSIHHLGPTPERSQTTIWGLGRFLGEDSAYGTQADDTLTLTVPPMSSHRGIRAVQTFTHDSLVALQHLAVQEFVQRMSVFPAYKSRQRKA
jgi:CRISPR-associated RAMP protein (TIGR02581 family)